MPHRAEIFSFENFNWDPSKKILSCEYAIDNKYHFTETFEFDFEFISTIDREALNKAFEGLWLMAGISYYKALIPKKINLPEEYLQGFGKAQSEFFNTTYTHGLGEFSYQNQIPIIRPEFPYNASPNTPKTSSLKPEVIVPLGGGKDSLTTIELLKKAKIPFCTWTVGSYPGLEKTLEIIRKDNPDHEHITIKRHIDKSLLELNKEGAYNGHIPISAIWGFLSICTALLTGKKYIAFSNENSANEATTHYQDLDINHQYSKSFDFERQLQHYIEEFIHPSLHYFSALRPLDELFIAEIFSKLGWEKYKNAFSSCNRNFHLTGDKKEFFWCGECPKCAFVFTILAPFIEREELTQIFGENLFEKTELKETFDQLLGKTESKPFECVGTINEVRQSMILAEKNFPEVKSIRDDLVPEQNFNYQTLNSHQIPSNIWTRLKTVITTITNE